MASGFAVVGIVFGVDGDHRRSLAVVRAGREGRDGTAVLHGAVRRACSPSPR